MTVKSSFARRERYSTLKSNMNHAERWFAPSEAANSVQATLEENTFKLISMRQRAVHNVGYVWEETRDLQERQGVQTVARCAHLLEMQAAIAIGCSTLFVIPGQQPFMNAERQRLVREVLVSGTVSERCAALHKLVPFMTAEYEQLLMTAGEHSGIHMYVMLADAPLIEMLPALSDLEQRMEVLQRLAAETDDSYEQQRLHQQWLKLKQCKQWLHNVFPEPMNISGVVPEWIDMQAEALFRAEKRAHDRGRDVRISVLLPFAGGEWKQHAQLVRTAAEQIRCHDVKRDLPLVGVWLHSGISQDENSGLLRDMTEADVVWVCSEQVNYG